MSNYPVGKCNCLTKTPDPEHHDEHCPIYLWDEVHQTIKVLAKVMEPFKDISDENLLLNWQRDARKAIRRYNR